MPYACNDNIIRGVIISDTYCNLKPHHLSLCMRVTYILTRCAKSIARGGGGLRLGLMLWSWLWLILRLWLRLWLILKVNYNVMVNVNVNVKAKIVLMFIP